MTLLGPVIAAARPELGIAEPPVEPYGDQEWAALTQMVSSHRLSGLLWDAIEAGLPVSPTQQIDAATFHHQSLQAITELEAGALWVLDRLQTAAVDARLIKGLATAHAVHSRPQQRDTGDIDLLVRPDQFVVASDVLRQCGLREERRWGRAADTFAKENVFLLPGGLEVDLHQSLAFGQRWRRLTPELMDDGIELPHGRTLSMEGLFISACVSAAGSDWRVSGLLDVAAISHHVRLDRHRLAALVASNKLRPMLLPVIDRAAEFFVVNHQVRQLIEAQTSSYWANGLQRIETSKGGARFLYSCLSGPASSWPRGLHALVFPDVSGQEAAGNGKARRLFNRSAELIQPGSYR